MIMGLLRHTKTDWNVGQKPGMFLGDANAIEVLTRMEHQLVLTNAKPLLGQDVFVGAPVSICLRRSDMDTGVDLDPVERNF